MPVQSEIRLVQFIISLKISRHLPSLTLPVGGYSWPCLMDAGLHTASTVDKAAYVQVHMHMCPFARNVVCFCIHYCEGGI